MTVTQKGPVNEGSPTPSPIPSLVTSSVAMVQGDTIGLYTLYKGDSQISSTVGAKYGVASGQFSDTFKDVADLGETCQTIDTASTNESDSTFGNGSINGSSQQKLEQMKNEPRILSPAVPEVFVS